MRPARKAQLSDDATGLFVPPGFRVVWWPSALIDGEWQPARGRHRGNRDTPRLCRLIYLPATRCARRVPHEQAGAAGGRPGPPRAAWTSKALEGDHSSAIDGQRSIRGRLVRRLRAELGGPPRRIGPAGGDAAGPAGMESMRSWAAEPTSAAHGLSAWPTHSAALTRAGLRFESATRGEGRAEVSTSLSAWSVERHQKGSTTIDGWTSTLISVGLVTCAVTS